MEVDDTLYREFLKELEVLDRFRMSYQTERSVPLDVDDPDVRRMIEAMAVFSARTRMIGERAGGRATMRLFRQHFSYLLSPMPTMALFQARPNRRLADGFDLPRRSRLSVLGQVQNGQQAQPESAMFRTLAPLEVRPVELVDVRKIEGRPCLVFERFSAGADDLSELTIHVGQLGDFTSSLSIFHHLRDCVRKAHVRVRRPDGTEVESTPCPGVHFGPRRGVRHDLDPHEHSLQRARSFFHLPEQALFMTIELPERLGVWSRMRIELELSDEWPRGLQLHPDYFRLHVVPVVNLQREMASPIECDGTKERYRVLHAEAAEGVAPHSVVGVYRLDDKAGLEPLAPGIVRPRREQAALGEERASTFEVEYEGQKTGRRGWVILDIPGVFWDPAGVAVDALWFRPGFAYHAEELGIEFADRSGEGIDWQCLRDLRPAADTPLDGDWDGLLRLMAMRGQSALDLSDLRFLLEVLGARRSRHFREIVDRIRVVEHSHAPYALTASGFKYVYRIEIGDLDGSRMPAADLLARNLVDILESWSTEEVVEVVLEIPNLEVKRSYKRREEASS